MSIGNLKDSGNQGNNFPWQLKMLQGLQCICDEVKAINIDTDDLEQLLADLIDELAAGIDVNVTNNISLSSSTLAALENTTVSITSSQFTKTITPNLIISTGTSGSIASLVYSISFASNGTGPALVSVDNGITYHSIPTGTTINLDAGSLNWTYAANRFRYDTTAAGASLIITFNN